MSAPLVLGPRRLSLFTAVFTLLVSVSPAMGQTDPRDIIVRIDRLLRGDSSRAVATMEVVTEHWERQMTMEMWSLGTDYTLVRLRAPAKEAGTATLMADDNIWNYLPKVDRTIKIPSSMMGGAWMGSHFTNDDLVQESQMIDVYDVEVAFEGERDGVIVWELRLTPKPEAAVVWGHLEFLVGQNDYLPLWAKYYDEDGDLARTMEYSEFREFSGRLVPAVMNMVPADKPDERTTIRYEDLEFDVDVDPSFFSLRTLQSRR
jgi:outer membrane lipoprotein-sorting protein